MRSVAGGYDNESVAVSLIILTFLCWVSSLRYPSVFILFYFYFITPSNHSFIPPLFLSVVVRWNPHRSGLYLYGGHMGSICFCFELDCCSLLFPSLCGRIYM